MGNIMKVMGNPNNIPFLPYEIIFNILKRLPVKFLIQFQCVCKDWKNLINSPSFIRDHLTHTSSHRPIALLSHKPMFKSSFRFQLLDRRNMQVLKIQTPPLMDSFICLRIVGSCNGLVCLQVTNEINWACYILLWNPATRQFRKIPRSTIEDFQVDYTIGFEFIATDNDYKIVIIRCHLAVNPPVKVKVYSLNSGSWKEVEFENLEGTISITSFGNVILNGVMYGLGSSHGDYYDMVVSIDLTKHVCKSIPLPDLGSKKSRRVKLMLYENKPTVLGVTISSLVHLWVMEEDTCTSRGRWIWTKKYTCNFCVRLCGMVRVSPFVFDPMTIWKDEVVFRVRSRFSICGGMRKFCLVNLKTSECKNFLIKCPPGSAPSDFNYVESLVSVGNIKDKEP